MSTATTLQPFVEAFLEERHRLGFASRSMGYALRSFAAYVDDLDKAQKLFVEDLTSTLQVIALDAKVQVDFNPDVVAYYRLIGYENRDVADQDFRNDAVDAGEIGAGHSATALYAVMFRPNTEGRIATVQLRWEDPDTHQVTEIAP